MLQMLALAASVKQPYPGWDCTDIVKRPQKPQFHGMRAEHSCATGPCNAQSKTTHLHGIDTSAEEVHEEMKQYFLEQQAKKAVLLFFSKGSTPIN